MVPWVDKGADQIVDTFIADDGSDDLFRLERAIGVALGRAYERGIKETGSPLNGS
jgi:hypothetical protein